MATVAEKMTAIADAIRAKTGSTEPLTLDGMATAIAGIEGGGGGGDDQFAKLLTDNLEVLDSDVTSVRNHTFYNSKTLTTVNLPNATSIGDYAFYYCRAVTSVNAPNVTSLGEFAFCANRFERVKFPLLTSVTEYSFESCISLAIADFDVANNIGSCALRYCKALKALILRKTDAITTLYSTSSVYGSGIEYKTCYIYVPAALVASYKEDSMWTRYSSLFRALEDYTVDGTITGELDESKI